MVIGIDNASEHRSAKITVDTDGLRLRIAFDADRTSIGYCTTGSIVVGNPTLSRKP